MDIIFRYAFWRYDITKYDLREKCLNTEFFLVRIFPYSDWIRRHTFMQWSSYENLGNMILQRSDSPVSITKEFWKLCRRLVTARLIYFGFIGFLKDVWFLNKMLKTVNVTKILHFLSVKVFYHQSIITITRTEADSLTHAIHKWGYELIQNGENKNTFD